MEYVFGSVRRWWRGSEWMRGLGLGFTNPVGTGGVFDVYLWWVAVVYGLGPWFGRVGWCYVCVRCESGFSV